MSITTNKTHNNCNCNYEASDKSTIRWCEAISEHNSIVNKKNCLNHMLSTDID